MWTKYRKYFERKLYFKIFEIIRIKHFRANQSIFKAKSSSKKMFQNWLPEIFNPRLARKFFWDPDDPRGSKFQVFQTFGQFSAFLSLFWCKNDQNWAKTIKWANFKWIILWNISTNLVDKNLYRAYEILKDKKILKIRPGLGLTLWNLYQKR